MTPNPACGPFSYAASHVITDPATFRFRSWQSCSICKP